MFFNKIFLQTFVVFGLFFLVKITNVSAATYFIDFTSGSDSGSGLTTSTAWKHIPWDDNWTGVVKTFSAGDIVAFKPDTTYTGSLIQIKQSGTTSNPIVLSGSPADWGSGTQNASFSGNAGLWDGVFTHKSATNYSYVTFRDMIFNTGDGQGFVIAPDSGTLGGTHYINNLILKNIEVKNFAGSYYGNYFLRANNLQLDNVSFHDNLSGGARIENSLNVLVKKSEFYNNGSGGNIDGLFLGSDGVGNDITFVVQDSRAWNNGVGGTGSGFDTSNSNSSTISSAIFERNISYSNGNYGFSGSSANGIWRNNIALNNESNFSFYESGSCAYYNNTSYNPKYWAFSIDEEGGTEQTICTLNNNIAMKDAAFDSEINYGGINIEAGVAYTGDNNNVFELDGNWGRYNGVDVNSTTWKTLSTQDQNSKNVNPQFLAQGTTTDPIYYMLQVSSLLKDSAVTVAGFANDFVSMVRPQGSSWDIGAFEIEVVQTPQASSTGGTYTQVQSVTLTSITTSSTIYYTLDGSVPNASSTLYATPILIATSSMLKAIAVKPNSIDSAIMTESYIINIVLPVPTISTTTPLTGPVTGSTTITIMGSNFVSTPSVTIGTSSATNVQFISSSSITALTPANSVGVYSIVLINPNGQSATATNAYTYVASITPQAISPSATPAGGTYTQAQSITLTSITTSSTIYYTLDGSVPSTSSTVYSGSISINNSATLKAITIRSGYIDSAIMIASYVINISTGGGGGGYTLPPTIPATTTIPKSATTTSSTTSASTTIQKATSTKPKVVTMVKLTESQLLMQSNKNLDQYIRDLKLKKDSKAQKNSIIKYTTPLVKADKKISQSQIFAINNFLVYGTQSTKKLSINKRFLAIKKFKAQFKKLPKSESDWVLVFKIAKSIK
ncbi:MAG: chitobiase/beta-hexosaminidase C-terminal domain-containing protein [Candidatus Falkowbacteria bacterium]